MHYEFHPWWTILTILIVMGALQGTCAYLILLERKTAAWVQDRLGPNRVGPWGFLQPIADGIKMLLKEDVIPAHVDKLFYLLAPAIAISTATLAFAVVPFGPTTPPPRAAWPQNTHQEMELRTPEIKAQAEDYNSRYQAVLAPHVDVGIVYTFAISSLTVYGIVLGGWSSNNKYSFMGGLRSSAQIISYEIPMAMSILGVVILSGSLNLERIIQAQLDHGWFVLYQPLAALLFLVSMFAECNRLPFDLPETEQELVGGFHTEYSAMKFGLFFLGEYTHMVTTSFLLNTLFFGGWHFPWISTPESLWIVKLLVFALKMMAIIMLFMMIRWTIPRFRFDQLMGLAWKGLIPLALANFVGVLIVKHLSDEGGWSDGVKMAILFPLSGLLFLLAGLFTVNRGVASPTRGVAGTPRTPEMVGR